MPLRKIQEGGGVMAAYIDREASVESLNAMKPFLRDRGQVQLLRRIMNHIGKIPAADVVPVVHGRWKNLLGDCRGYSTTFECSNCETLSTTSWAMKECEFEYCPNCGARMDGDGND